MMRLRQNWIAYLVPAGFVMCLGILSGCRGSVSESPPIHLNPNMDNQARFDPQEPNSFFKDNRAMRTLVKGTVARGFLRADGHLFRGKVKGKFAKTLPASIVLNEQLLKRGQDRFNIFCSACHGYSGDGNGVVTQYSRAMNPANLHDDLRRAMVPGVIFDRISNGKMANGAIAMPPFRNQLSVQDRWAVVAYVRALQLSRYPLAALKKGQK